MASNALIDTRPLIGKVKLLINSQLKEVLKREGLAVSGLKAALQERIITHINAYASSRNYEGFNRVRALVNDPKANLTPSPGLPRTPQPGPSLPPINPGPYHSIPNGHARPPQPTYAPKMPPQSFGPARLHFKDSPFYTILEPLISVLECKVRESTRDHVETKIIFRADIADRLVSEPNLRVMLYCAADPVTPFSRADIAFPYQVEIRINGDEVKSNLRGLKNKPGSTRPADITGFVRKRTGYENMMTVTYALTQIKFHLVVNLVKQHPVEELVARLKAGKIISRDQVVREMVSKAQDPDIQATSSIMSLKCPVSTLRIDVPCRSTVCLHNQCYDAPSFLQLQEQAPTWTCPVCGKLVSFESLMIDQYVDNILKSTAREVDQVTIEPDGIWRPTSDDDGPSHRSGGQQSDSDDGDLIEIKDMPRMAAVKSESGPGNSSLMMRTPPTSSREPSISSGRPSSTSHKRPAPEVIDLSSDDDQPPRAPKRQATNSQQPNGVPLYPQPPDSSRSPYPHASSFTLPQPRSMQSGPLATSNPMAQGYRNPQS